MPLIIGIGAQSTLGEDIFARKYKTKYLNFTRYLPEKCQNFARKKYVFPNFGGPVSYACAFQNNSISNTSILREVISVPLRVISW